MCRMIYIGSDESLPLTDPFDEKKPRFHVIPADKGIEAAVREHLRTTYVVYAGSTTGCGCNFQYESAESLKRWHSIESNEVRELLEGSTEDKRLADHLFDLWSTTANQDSRREYLKYWLQDKQSVDDLRVYLDRASKTRPVRVLVTEYGKESVPPQCVLSVAPDFFGGESFDFISFVPNFGTLLEVGQKAVDPLLQLEWALQTLAQSAEVQVWLTPDFVDVGEQLAGECFYIMQYALSIHGQNFSNQQIGVLQELESALRSSGFNDRWSKEALCCGAEWEEIRRLARNAIDEFGWLNQIPPERKGRAYGR